MGRALRRQQERAARRQQRQQQRAAAGGSRGPSLSVSAPAGAGTDARAGRSRFVPRWVSDIISELRKVTWPSRHEVGYLTLVVIIVSAFFGLILGAADLGFGWLIENTVLR